MPKSFLMQKAGEYNIALPYKHSRKTHSANIIIYDQILVAPWWLDKVSLLLEK